MLPALLAAALASAVTHPPAVQHYRVELRASRHIDRSPTDTTGGDYHAVAFLSATRRDTVGGQVGRVVIDSVTCAGTGILSMAYDPSVGRASRGAWYDVLLVKGEPETLPKPSLRNPLTDALAQVTLELFPPARRKSAVGEMWVDTLNIATASDRWSETSPAITKWKVISAGGDGVVIEGDLTVVVSVTGQVTATGMIIGKRTIVVTPAGVVRSATLATTQQMLAAAQSGTEIRAPRGSTSATITLLGETP